MESKVFGNQTVMVGIPAVLFGGSGASTISVAGSSANNILVGGPGSNMLTGGGGRDILIGGGGPSTLQAGSGNGDDILIAGETAYDSNVTALLALMSVWGRSDSNSQVDYLQRVSDLFGPGAGLLNQMTVAHDAAVSQLDGNAGHDWFWFAESATAVDKLQGVSSGEVATRAANALNVFFQR